MTPTEAIGPAAESRSHTVRRAVPRTRTNPHAPESISSGRVAPEQRERMVAEAAYFRAEHRGFAPGAELDDWLEAEVEIALALGNAEDEKGSS